MDFGIYYEVFHFVSLCKSVGLHLVALAGFEPATINTIHTTAMFDRRCVLQHMCKLNIAVLPLLWQRRTQCMDYDHHIDFPCQILENTKGAWTNLPQYLPQWFWPKSSYIFKVFDYCDGHNVTYTVYLGTKWTILSLVLICIALIRHIHHLFRNLRKQYFIHHSSITLMPNSLLFTHITDGLLTHFLP